MHSNKEDTRTSLLFTTVGIRAVSPNGQKTAIADASDELPSNNCLKSWLIVDAHLYTLRKASERRVLSCAFAAKRFAPQYVQISRTRNMQRTLNNASGSNPSRAIKQLHTEVSYLLKRSRLQPVVSGRSDERGGVRKAFPPTERHIETPRNTFAEPPYVAAKLPRRTPTQARQQAAGVARGRLCQLPIFRSILSARGQSGET